MFSCKSTSVVSADQTLDYAVVFEKNATPQVLKKAVACEVIDYLVLDEKLNQWHVSFKGQTPEDKKLKTSLLNHPKVISVLTMAEYKIYQRKKGNKSTQAPHGKGGVSKH